MLEPEPVKKLRFRAVAARLRGSVMAKLRLFKIFFGQMFTIFTQIKRIKRYTFKKAIFLSRAGGQDWTGSTTPHDIILTLKEYHRNLNEKVFKLFPFRTMYFNVDF